MSKKCDCGQSTGNRRYLDSATVGPVGRFNLKIKSLGNQTDVVADL